MLPSPSGDVVWAALFAASAAIVGWVVAQVLDARQTRQKLSDHILDCDKRQIYTMKMLEEIKAELSKVRDTQVGRPWWRH